MIGAQGYAGRAEVTTCEVGPLRGLEAVEFATLEWVDWFNHRRLLELIGDRPTAEVQAAHRHQSEHPACAACLN